MGLGLHSAIHIAHMGMSAAEKSINVSGNNLANSNTYGYKAERPDFASFLSYTYKYGSTPGQTYTAGTNPLQIGMGVELASVTTDFTQGSFKEGMTNSDIAINGNGFLVVQQHGSSMQYYTRNGALKVNENFDLVTNTGLYVMGYGVDDHWRILDGELTTLKIPVGEMHIAEATENAWLEGMLNANGPDSTQGTVLQTKAMTDLSAGYPADQKATVSQLVQPHVENVTKAGGSSTGGGMESGNYLYRITYLDANGVESDYSGPISVKVEAGQDSVSLTDLPGIPDGYDSLRIYRAVDPGDPSAQATFHQVADLAAPATTYTDVKSTADIASSPELDQSRMSQGSYQYYVTYTDQFGNESRPSAISDSFNLNQGGQAILSDIPTVGKDNPDGWTGRRVYRSTANDPSNFYLVGEINNMNADETLIDRFSDAQITDGTHAEISEAGRGNAMVNGSTKLLDVGSYENGRFVPAFEEGTLTFDPTKGGKPLRSTSLEITAETTVDDYLKFLNESFGIRSTADGVPADQGELGKTINGGAQGATVIDGVFYILGNAGKSNALEIDNTQDMWLQTANGKKQINLGWGQDATNKQDAIGEGTATDMEVFDSLGSPVGVRMTFTLESKSDTETVYRWYADSSDNQPEDGQAIAAGTGLLRFDQHGQLIDASNTTISVQRTQIASESPLDFDFNMNFDALKALTTENVGITQTYQDGAGAGTLYDYSIAEDGTIIGYFDSGVFRPLGQIPLATFRNQEGLYKSGDSLFQESTNSGQAKLGIAGQSGVGSIESNKLELSNTDIGQEMVDMILASSMYRANAKVMTTSNEMYDALLRIK